MTKTCGCQVGNDAVDQLSKFNGRLADLAGRPNPHTIDGIVLTKMDTIDDKARLTARLLCLLPSRAGLRALRAMCQHGKFRSAEQRDPQHGCGTGPAWQR